VTRTFAGLAAAFALTLVPASAGAGARPLALTASPARLVLSGSTRASVRVRNAGTKRIALDVASAGFALDLRGRPRIVGRHRARSAAGWLKVRPGHVTLGPRSAARLQVSARVPRHAEPGDHDALVLLVAHPLANARVSVRLRLGVVVVVRAPGTVVRRLRLGALRLTRRGSRAALELMVVNAGNVTERLLHVRMVVSRLGAKRRLATVAAGARELRPRTRGLLAFPVRTRVHGSVTARVVIPGEPGRPAVSRTYRLRL
jgi:hypothetical protein